MKSRYRELKKAIIMLAGSFMIFIPAFILWYSIINSRQQIVNEELLATEKHLIRKSIEFEQTANPTFRLMRSFSIDLNTITEATQNMARMQQLSFFRDNLQPYFSKVSRETGFPCEVSCSYFSEGKTAEFHLKNDMPVKQTSLARLTQLMFALNNVFYKDNMERSELEQQLLQETRQQLAGYQNFDFLQRQRNAIQKILIRKNGQTFLFFSVMRHSSFLANFIFDITSFSEEQAARIKTTNLVNYQTGLAFIDEEMNFKTAIISDRLKKKPNILKKAFGMLKRLPNKQLSFQINDEFFLALPRTPQNRLRTVISASVPQSPPLRELQLLLAIVCIMSLAVVKILGEALLLDRFPKISIRTLIFAVFLLVSVLPLVSAIYLSNEYLIANYKKEKNTALNLLNEEIATLDLKTLDNFRENLNNLKLLSSVSKLQSFTGKTENNIENLLAATLTTIKQRLKFRSVFETWIYDESQKFRSIRWGHDAQNYYKEPNVDEILSSILSPRFADLLKQNKRQAQIKHESKIEIDQVKLELADEIFLAIFGQKIYFAMKKDLGTLIKIQTFFEKSFLISIPIFNREKLKYIFTHIIDSDTLRKHFPKESLKENQILKTLILYGADSRYSVTHPGSLAENSKKFPDLLQLAKDSNLAKVRLEKHIQNASQSAVFIAQPARYSDYVIAGKRFSRTLESFRKEITGQIIRATLLLTLLMMILAFLASTYFLIPINQLSKATRQIIKENYDCRIPENHPDEFSDIAATFNLMTSKLKEGKLLKSFVAASLEAQLDKHEEISGNDARREKVTIIFSNIMNFKNSVPEMQPQDTYNLLKCHLEAASKVSEKFAGEIDKMIEDKVMIVFTEQPGAENHALRAIQAAKTLAASFFATSRQHLAIGINSGTVITGIMGAETVRLAKTVVGDPVNLAARLASVAETLPAGGLVVGKQTLEQAAAKFEVEKLNIGSVKGKTQKVEIFRLRN